MCVVNWTRRRDDEAGGMLSGESRFGKGELRIKYHRSIGHCLMSLAKGCEIGNLDLIYERFSKLNTGAWIKNIVDNCVGKLKQDL